MKTRQDGACREWLDTHRQRHEKKTQAAKTTNALRVPGALGAAARTYAQCMDKAPLATKAATSAAIFGASDACAQKLEQVKEPDATRLLTTTAIGGLYFAPAVRTRRGIVSSGTRVDGVEVAPPRRHRHATMWFRDGSISRRRRNGRGPVGCARVGGVFVYRSGAAAGDRVRRGEGPR